MQLHTIEPGSFLMGDQKVPTTISKSFDMMDTPVTQKQYALIMGENPSYFIDGPDTQFMQINGKEIKLQSENPVEQVNASEDIPAFIKKVNELSQQGDPLLFKLIPGHKKGDVYRLPTEAEWEFVTTNRGQVTTRFYHGDDEAELGEYAWYSENSKGTTHPVGKKLPTIVDGPNGEKLNFYDLQGNVSEWTQDLWDDNLSGGVDPQGAKTGSDCVVRGGSWRGNARHLRSADRYGGSASDRGYGVGFRLVRTH